MGLRHNQVLVIPRVADDCALRVFRQTTRKIVRKDSGHFEDRSPGSDADLQVNAVCFIEFGGIRRPRPYRLSSSGAGDLPDSISSGSNEPVGKPAVRSKVMWSTNWPK